MIAAKLLPDQPLRPTKDQTVLAGEGNGKPRTKVLTVRVDEDFMAALDEAVRLHVETTGETVRKSDLVRIVIAEFLGIEGVATTTKEARQPSLPLKGGSSTTKS